MDAYSIGKCCSESLSTYHTGAIPLNCAALIAKVYRRAILCGLRFMNGRLLCLSQLRLKNGETVLLSTCSFPFSNIKRPRSTLVPEVETVYIERLQEPHSGRIPFVAQSIKF
jgi:hypothetical protein